ncbi:MAG: hypothetical protein LH606_18065 [Cytophagaceae bacterium]|nr:hypothetical protein [Cytophagaceae bacterium]
MPEQETSFGRKILNFFVKESEGSASSHASPPTTANAAKTTAAGPVTTPTLKPTAGGSLDTRFVDHFASVLDKTNLKGPDYFEFRETLRSLNNLGLTEEKQFQAAWASFKAMGGIAEVAVLTNTANQYLTALNADREAFLKSVDGAVAEKVGSLQNEQKNLQAENESLAKQMQELQNRMSANLERLTKTGGEIEEQSGKIKQNRDNYEVTFATFTEKIKNDLAKIAQFLK